MSVLGFELGFEVGLGTRGRHLGLGFEIGEVCHKRSMLLRAAANVVILVVALTASSALASEDAQAPLATYAVLLWPLVERVF